MKTLKKILSISFFVVLTVNANAQSNASWTSTGSSSITLNPLTANVGIGTSNPAGKLHIVHDHSASGNSYGIYLTTNNTFSGDGPTYGIRSASTTGADNTGIQYGVASFATNNNTTSTSSTFGFYTKVSWINFA